LGQLTVEAGVRAGKPLLVAIVAVDVESIDTVHAFQFLESVQRHLGRARDELQKLGPLLLVERPHRTPEPLDLLRRSSVVVVFGVALPVIHVDIGKTRDEKLKLLLREDGDEVLGDNIMEP
jgi:hypothetical protein